MEIDMTIHDIVSEHDGVILIGRNGERIKVKLNEQERELLKERLEDKVWGLINYRYQISKV